MNISNPMAIPSVRFSGWRRALAPVAGFAFVASACSSAPRDAVLVMGDTGLTDVVVTTKPDGDTKYTFNTDHGPVEVLVIPGEPYDSLISIKWQDTAANVTYSYGDLDSFVAVTSMGEDGQYSQSEIDPAEARLELESSLASLIASNPNGALQDFLAGLR